MKASRVLLVSNVRPSRTWNFANRIVREVPGTEVCGIVQSPMRSIPWIQKMVASGYARELPPMPGRWPKVRSFFHFVVDKMVEWFLWFVHGCPASLDNSRFTLKTLKQKCYTARWPLTVPSKDKETHILALSIKDAELIIVLGEFSSLPDFTLNTSKGCLQACTRGQSIDGESCGDALICIEHLAQGMSTSSSLFSQILPWQPFDGPSGFTLKADLITDDLLLQAARSLLTGSPETASKEVSEWAVRVLAPSLSQLKSSQKSTFQSGKRCRSTWKLCLDTLLLLSPTVLGRNWYRRLTRRYPVLILANHLISDRPHRMGVPTEICWRQVLFLKKHYRIVTLAEASELLRSTRIPVPTVVLTFDDGYGDNFLGLRAVASETETPSTLFITSGPVEAHQEFDHDLATGKTGFLPLTWDQITYWHARGAELGSHTRTHFDCGSTDLEHLQMEIVCSRQDLEAQLKKPVTFFAFPYGKPENMSRPAMDLAATTYRHYVSSFGGECLSNAEKPQSHLFRKKFYGSPWELELELQSVFDFVDGLKQRFQFRGTPSSSDSDRASAVPTLSPSIKTVSAPGSQAAAYSRVKDA